MRRNLLHEESYQCVCAIYRGWEDRTEFHLGEKQSELQDWLQFINVETVTKCASAIYTGSVGHLMQEQ
jgi:4'-phosphopantetheinyl transferase